MLQSACVGNEYTVTFVTKNNFSIIFYIYNSRDFERDKKKTSRVTTVTTFPFSTSLKSKTVAITLLRDVFKLLRPYGIQNPHLRRYFRLYSKIFLSLHYLPLPYSSVPLCKLLRGKRPFFKWDLWQHSLTERIPLPTHGNLANPLSKLLCISFAYEYDTIFTTNDCHTFVANSILELFLFSTPVRALWPCVGDRWWTACPCNLGTGRSIGRRNVPWNIRSATNRTVKCTCIIRTQRRTDPLGVRVITYLGRKVFWPVYIISTQRYTNRYD